MRSFFVFCRGAANVGASQVLFFIRYENPRKNIKEREMISILAMYGALGAVAGILAGLLGIGGGLGEPNSATANKKGKPVNDKFIKPICPNHKPTGTFIYLNSRNRWYRNWNSLR